MKKNRRDILVYLDWRYLDEEPVYIGILRSERLRGKEVFSFEYDKSWLQSNPFFLLDPELEFYEGMHFLAHSHRPNFGLFMDSAPDRWGRVLLDRREAIVAQKENRPVRQLFETDYLLGVCDVLRMGALRFKLKADGPFLGDEKDFVVPPISDLKALEAISFWIDEDDSALEQEYTKWVKLLVAPGSSLGGTRPKANVRNSDGSLWIAKFPKLQDDSDVGAWEMVAYKLACAAGIEMASSFAQKFTKRHHTFITKRFDREEGNRRIHFASAMTMLGYADGDNFQTGVSYLELAEFIKNYAANPDRDLKQLWRRIVFNIAISNTDDHLRNHGFLLHPKGWQLSPAYDLNPQERGIGLSLNITETNNDLDIELPMEVHTDFRLNYREAEQIKREVMDVVKNWAKEAKQLGISREERARKAPAFRAIEKG